MSEAIQLDSLRDALAASLLLYLAGDIDGYLLPLCIQEMERSGFAAEEIRRSVDQLVALGLVALSVDPERGRAPILRTAPEASFREYKTRMSAPRGGAG